MLIVMSVTLPMILNMLSWFYSDSVGGWSKRLAEGGGQLSYLLPDSLSGLQGVAAQNADLFIVTSARTSNLKGFSSDLRTASLQLSSIVLEEVSSFIKNTMFVVLLFSFPFYPSVSFFISYYPSFFMLYLFLSSNLDFFYFLILSQHLPFFILRPILNLFIHTVPFCLFFCPSFCLLNFFFTSHFSYPFVSSYGLFLSATFVLVLRQCVTTVAKLCRQPPPPKKKEKNCGHRNLSLKNVPLRYEILSSHEGEHIYQDYSLLRRDVYSGRQVSTFRRNLLPPTSVHQKISTSISFTYSCSI